MLCISVRVLEKLEKMGDLEDKLNLCGYKYHGKDISKKPHKYKLTLEDKDKKEFYDMCNKELKTDGSNEFQTYFIKRETKSVEQNNLIMTRDISRRELSKIVGVGESTINKWDKIMLEKGILVEVDKRYFKKNKTNQEVCEITKDEYWSHFLDNDIVTHIEDDYLNGIITEDEYRTRLKAFSKELDKNCDHYYFKSSKYAVDTSNELYKQLKFLSDMTGE